MKIKVTSEGRKDIWIPEKESLIEFIKTKCGNEIHSFVPSGPMIIGADHEKESVIEDIENGDRLAVFTDETANMGHSLAIIKNNRLECYDIGRVSENDLEKI